MHMEASHTREIIDGEIERHIRDFSKNYLTSLQYLWLEGLPSFARMCIWPLIVGNSLGLTYQLYVNLVQQVQTIKNTERPRADPHLSLYMTPMGSDDKHLEDLIYGEQPKEEDSVSIMQETFNRIQEKVYKISKKVEMQLLKDEVPMSLFEVRIFLRVYLILFRT